MKEEFPMESIKRMIDKGFNSIAARMLKYLYGYYLELIPYLDHKATCNLKQDWSEAEQAMADTPMEFRGESWDQARHEMDEKRNTCTCGLKEKLENVSRP